jgi:hypothetical protein
MKSRIVEQAREYLAANAAESGADVLISELCDEVERMARWAEVEVARRTQAMESLDKVIRQLSFVSSCFGPPDVKGPDGKMYTLKDELKLQHFEAVRNHIHREGMKPQ